MSSLLALLAPLAVTACWLGVLWFGFSEAGPRWLVPALFFGGVLSGVYALVFLYLWLVGVVDFDPIITLEVNK